MGAKVFGSVKAVPRDDRVRARSHAGSAKLGSLVISRPRIRLSRRILMIRHLLAATGLRVARHVWTGRITAAYRLRLLVLCHIYYGSLLWLRTLSDMVVVAVELSEVQLAVKLVRRAGGRKRNANYFQEVALGECCF